MACPDHQPHVLNDTPLVKKVRLAIETSAVKSLAWLLPKLSRRVIMLASQSIGYVAYLADFRGRETALENLRAAFRGIITEEQARRAAIASYQTFARTFLDLFWSLRLTKENASEYVTIRFDDPEVVNLARERGAIWVTPHFGNYELVSYIWGFQGFHYVAVAQDFKNPALTAIFRNLRQGSGHTIISQDGAMLRLAKTLTRKGHVGLLTDLNIKPGKMAAVIDCFNLKTCVTTLHASLAIRYQVPIITGVCECMPDGGYVLHMHRALDPANFDTPKKMTQAVWDIFEQDIRRSPEAWLWMYKHWRYLPGKDIDRDPRYPAYANALRAFRELMNQE